jgi:hypothetical protein
VGQLLFGGVEAEIVDENHVGKFHRQITGDEVFRGDALDHRWAQGLAGGCIGFRKVALHKLEDALEVVKHAATPA